MSPHYYYGALALFVIFSLLYKLIEIQTPRFDISLYPTRLNTENEEGPISICFINLKVKSNCKVDLKRCRAELRGLLKNGGRTNFEVGTPLVWNTLPHNHEREILLGGEGVVHIVAANSKTNQLQFWEVPYVRFEKEFDELATYRFTVYVNCDGKSKEITFDLVWNGKWDEMKTVVVRNG